MQNIFENPAFSMSALMAANPAIKSPDKIFLGEKLVIPAPDSSPLLDAGTPSPSAVANPSDLPLISASP